MYDGCTDLNSFRVAWLEHAYTYKLRPSEKEFKTKVPERFTITVTKPPTTQTRVKHGMRARECGGGPNLGKPTRDKVGSHIVGSTTLGKGCISIPLHCFPEKLKDQNKAKLEVLLTMFHNMIHIATNDNKHGKGFRDMALRTGFYGDMAKMKATKDLRNNLATIALSMPDLPLGTGDGKSPGDYKGSTLKSYICACEDKAPVRSSMSTWAKLEKRGLIGTPCNECGQKMARDQAEIAKEEAAKTAQAA